MSFTDINECEEYYKQLLEEKDSQLSKAKELLNDSKDLFRYRRKLNTQNENEFTLEHKIADFLKTLK